MSKNELKKNIKVWCWWKSRHLYYVGKIGEDKYKFVDICDAITIISEEDLKKLEVR